MDTSHDVYLRVLSSGRGKIEAIRAIREQFGLDLRQAKEVSLQAEGVASSLDEHQERLVPVIEQALRQLAAEAPDADPSPDVGSQAPNAINMLDDEVDGGRDQEESGHGDRVEGKQ